MQVVSPEGLRCDGRREYEQRVFEARVGILKADGSCYFRMGNTILLAMVYGPQNSREFDINVEFQLASFASTSTTKRLKRDKRLMEIADQIKQAFLGLIFSTNSLINIYIQVIQHDGGLLHCALNATCLALIDAGIPMCDYLVAISSSKVLDLNLREENELGCLTLAVTAKNQEIVLLSSEGRIAVDDLPQMVELGKEGCRELYHRMDDCIRKSCSQ
jgi:exosome complex component RRP41